MKVHALLAVIGLVADDAFNRNAAAAADHPDAVRPFHIKIPEEALLQGALP
ncbi:MAG: hypothetical protein WB696_27635 [Chthoniobacterales bacterium]